MPTHATLSGGVIPAAQLGGGTPDGTKFLRDDGTWQTPSSGGVTNGDAHDHSGGDGAQIAYSTLSGAPTLYNQTVEDDGLAVTQRATINFVGAGVSVADTGSKTTVTIAGGAGQAFPVGAVYINVTGVNPGTELGYGTWSAFGAGRVMVGFNSGDTDFDTAEETGGSKTVASAGSNAAEAAHTHGVTSNVAVGDHASHTHTYTDVPNHVHPFTINSSTTDGTWASFDSSTTAGTARNFNTSNNTGGVTTGTTNGPNATLTHSVTNNAVTSAAGSSHNHAFTGSATSVVQPYIVAHFWKRTA